jgi:hypothetical protein
MFIRYAGVAYMGYVEAKKAPEKKYFTSSSGSEWLKNIIDKISDGV